MVARLGSIPARTGEPRSASNSKWNASQGLSPRVRGNPSVNPLAAASVAMVYPRAYGGTTSLVSCEQPTIWGLSPRVRGNRPSGCLRVSALGEGLSPRVRGNLMPRRPTRWPTCPRVYPRAYGGTIPRRRYPRFSTLTPTVYPRAYGGTFHSRGLNLQPRLTGSIPARTGEPTITFVAACNGWTVYPRAYGGTDRFHILQSLRRAAWRVYPRAYGGTHHAGLTHQQLCSPRVYPRAYGGTIVCRPRIVSLLMQGSIPARTGEPECHTLLV